MYSQGETPWEVWKMPNEASNRSQEICIEVVSKGEEFSGL
jgi:hypothetical protein